MSFQVNKIQPIKSKGFDIGLFFYRYRYLFYVLGFLVLLYLVYRRFFANVPKPSGQNTDTPVIKEPTKNATISDHQARAYAEQLFDAMAGFGTDEEVIYSVLKGKSLHDYNKIYNAFGLRSYIRLTGERSAGILGVDHSLTEWIIFELDLEELKKLKSINPALPF